ncbi:MAG: 2-phospho-L-lactate guanylyltransferase [Parasphingorhabdus sp.]|uniref:2-phospho-L-lactate guanylyltransferase n=1 Tax=Parasphingorhabdus sp. TaxID=2709688 RepID=UPI0030021A52
MIDWRVLVPIKQGKDSKSRLGSMMDPDARSDLAKRMAEHVLGVLRTCFDPSQITILSPCRPNGWKGGWSQDQGRGLNAELTAWRGVQGNAAILIIHADLPLLREEDVQAIVDTAKDGAAIATDRAGQGTNALAIIDGRPFTFCFGAESLSLHCRQYPQMSVLRRDGLMADLDTPDDAKFVNARGFAV